MQFDREKVLWMLRRFFRREPGADDPQIGVREPVRRGPGGRHAAVALEEPPFEATGVGQFPVSMKK